MLGLVAALAAVAVPIEDLAVLVASLDSQMHRHAKNANGTVHQRNDDKPMCRKAWPHGTERPGTPCDLDVGNSTSQPPPASTPPPSAPSEATCSALCFAADNPNFQTGAGFSASVASCVHGGYGCIGNTGCRVCSVQGEGLYGACPPCVLAHYGLSPPPPASPPPPPAAATPCASTACTAAVWATTASNGQGTCGAQITWVHQTGYAGASSWADACSHVGNQASTPECAPCSPGATAAVQHRSK